MFALLFAIADAITPGAFSYFELSFMSSGGATLALAAMGQTVVVLTGGFDLSAGAVVSLVNVVLGTWMGPEPSSQLLFGLIAIGIGAVVGAVNGFFVAVVRLQPIVVTLSTMFIVQGITLLIMDKPGGMIAPEFSAVLAGDAIPNLLPAAGRGHRGGRRLWLLLKNTRFGVGLYAVGSDPEAARAAGLATHAVQLGAYVVAGMFYGAAGAFISAQTGSADPLIGRPMLLQIFTAVVLGGTLLGGGRGGCLGSVVGAYTLVLVVNILLVLNVSAYYSSVAEGVILILAVLAASLNRRSAIADYLRLGWLKLRSRRDGTSPAAHPAPAQPFRLQRADVAVVPVAWLERHRELLRYVLPAYVGFVLVLVATHLVYGHTLTNPGYFNSLIVLASFLVVLALGQGAAILTGGLDLSLPWMIGLCGILVAGLVRGSDAVALWAIPLGLALGTGLGALNGAGIVLLGLPPIVMTLAMNGILQGAALVYSNGTPDGFASPGMRWFMTGRLLGATPVVWFVVAFVAAALVLLGPNHLRPPRLRGRQQPAGGTAQRRRCRRHADRRLCAVGLLRRPGRHPARRLQRPGQPRHGRRVPAAVDRRRRGRRHADHRRPRPLSGHAGRRAAAHRPVDAARRHDAAVRGARHHLRARRPGRGPGAARAARMSKGRTAWPS